MFRKWLPYLIGVALVAGGLWALAGCAVDDYIRVTTPLGIQETQNLPGKLSLTEARAQYARKLNQSRADFEAWADSIQQSEMIVAYLHGLTLAGTESLVGYGLGFLAVPAAGLVGLLFRRPGDADPERLRTEKEDSYNAGLAAGKALATRTS
jgi:hypothetical protein